MTAVEIREACYRDACFVVGHMRPSDELEVYCQVPDGMQRHQVAYSLLMTGGDAFVAYYRGTPALFFGTHMLNVASLNAWAVGTKLAWKVIPEATRFLTRDYLPEKVKGGVRSMEARSHVDHHAAHRWLESTGAVVSGDPFVYGKNGEKFVMYRWHPEAFEVAANRYKVDLS